MRHISQRNPGCKRKQPHLRHVELELGLHVRGAEGGFYVNYIYTYTCPEMSEIWAHIHFYSLHFLFTFTAEIIYFLNDRVSFPVSRQGIILYFYV